MASPEILNGVRWAPSQSQSAARIGSDVLPEVLPAVAQANKVMKASGNKIKVIDLITCCSVTVIARATNIEFLSALATRSKSCASS
jgi:hypothetical protein